MKRLLLVFFSIVVMLICSGSSFLDMQRAVISHRGVGVACEIGAVDATGTYETNTGAVPLISTDAYGQTFQVGTTGYLARICVLLNKVSGTFDLRIGDGENLTAVENDLLEDLGTSSANSGDPYWECFDSSSHPLLSTGTTYYIGCKENASSNVRWYYNSGGGYASGQATEATGGGGWVISVGRSYDYNFRIYLYKPEPCSP